MINPRVVQLAFALLSSTAFGAFAQEAVILVRHAELAAAPGVEPRQVPLSEDGQQRAQRLAALLANAGVSAVYATDFERTQATGMPIARLAGRDVTIVSKGDAADFVARLRREHAGQVVVVVGHTDTLPGIIKAYGFEQDVRIDSQDYGNVFVLAPRAGGPPALLRLRY